MRFAAVAALAGVAAAQGWPQQQGWGSTGVAYVTDVVTAYTTYCPASTQITHNGVTYTVTEATTLTITNCPCTVTRPVTSSVAVSSYCPTSAAPPPPPPAQSSGAPAVSSKTYFPSIPSASSSPTQTAPATYSGAASKVSVAGAGLLALLGVAAAL